MHSAPASSSQIDLHTQGLLFDMDGVLISSIGSVVRCWRQWAALYNVPNAGTYEVPHGRRAIDIVRELRPDIDAKAGLRAIEDLELADTADLTVLPGVKPLLSSLPPDRWAIVTSATRRLLLGRLAAAGLPVPERLVSAETVTHGKPDPEPYLLGAALLGFAPANCIVVEDAPSGVGAGIAAGCRVLGVLGTHSPADLHQAHWIAPSLDHVLVTAAPEGLSLRFTPIERPSPPSAS